jgi:hypothetical protein
LPQHSGRGGRSSGRQRRKRHKAPATEQSTTMRLAVTLASNAALPKPGATTPCVPAAPARSTSGAAAGRRGLSSVAVVTVWNLLNRSAIIPAQAVGSPVMGHKNGHRWSQIFNKHDPVILPSTMEKSLGRFTSLLESALNPFV